MKFKFLQPPSSIELAQAELPKLRVSLYDAEREAAKLKASLSYLRQRIDNLETFLSIEGIPHA